VRRVCCHGPCGQLGNIDQQRRPPRTQQHGLQQQVRAASRCQLMQEAERRLVLRVATSRDGFMPTAAVTEYETVSDAIHAAFATQ